MQPRILIISEAGAPSGYARVIRSIFTPLAREFEIEQLATRYDGGAHDWPWTLHAAATAEGPYGFDRVAPLVDSFRPDAVFLLNDLSFEGCYAAEVRRASHRPRIVAYVPVESGPLAPELLLPLDGVDDVATYTAYGRRQLEAAVAEARNMKPDFRFPDIDVIPHGVDTAAFHPLPGGRAEARRRLMPAVKDAERLFIVFNGNRNMPRKNIDVTIRGFARFAEGKPESVRLWLHMGVEDRGWNVAVLARRFGIEDRLMLTTGENKPPALDDATLNLIYNACDVGVNTCSGDAWGLVSFEHAATGAAQVVPEHTAQAELWRGAAELVRPRMTMIHTQNLIDAHLLDPEDVAVAFERLYADREYREAMAAAAYRNATRPEYRWERIAARFAAILWRN